MLSYAIIGFGGLGKLHLYNLDELSKKRGDFCLKAICGATVESFRQAVNLNLNTVDISHINPDNISFYSDYKELIDREMPDFIISAMPTYMHEEVAVYALKKGIHVFSEKPMALTVDSCRNIMETAEASGAKLMIGHCLRFDPAYAMLKSYIDSGCFGNAYRAEFTRYSKTPKWTYNNWILDPEKSGGCIMDMHIHDVDLINWFFGVPNSLRSDITEHKTKLESVFTHYYYDGLTVMAGADWSMPEKYPFTVRALINFDNATAELKDGKLTVYTDDGIITPKLSEDTCFEMEMEAFLSYVIDDTPCSESNPESIFGSVKIALAEEKSARQGVTVKV